MRSRCSQYKQSIGIELGLIRTSLGSLCSLGFWYPSIQYTQTELCKAAFQPVLIIVWEYTPNCITLTSIWIFIWNHILALIATLGSILDTQSEAECWISEPEWAIKCIWTARPPIVILCPIEIHIFAAACGCQNSTRMRVPYFYPHAGAIILPGCECHNSTRMKCAIIIDSADRFHN